MRTKKVQSKNMRKLRNKKLNKSKKCSCGVKLPFLKWGGDGPTNTNNNTDLTGKLTNLFSVASNKLTSDYTELKTNSTDAINNVTDSTKSVINDTGNQITENTKNVLNKTKGNAKTATDKTSGFFTDIFENAKNSLHDITKPKTATNNLGSFPSKPMPMSPKSTTSTGSLSSASKTNQTASLSTMSNSTNKSIQKSNSNSNSNNYAKNVVTRYRKLLNPSPSKQGGRKRSSKKSKSKKSKKSKRRKTYKHKGGSQLCMAGEPLGIEKSSLAFTGSPVSNINAVGPRPDQMYGQIPFPARRFNE
jgi:hypothetical protein